MEEQKTQEQEKISEQNPIQYEFKAYPHHCSVCFDVLIAKCKDPKLTEFSDILEKYPQQLLNFKCPIFVTWQFAKNQELRGCIGTFSPGVLSKLLPKYTIISGFQDNRFKPISLKEIPLLQVEVSLLSEFEPCANMDDWELGKHGLRIQFRDKKKNFYSGTFLPEVAVDWKWDKSQTIKELLEKADYYGKISEIQNVNLEKYETKVCVLNYEEYVSLKK